MQRLRFQPRSHPDRRADNQRAVASFPRVCGGNCFSGVEKMKYFESCASIEEAKKLYRELLKKHHPDLAGKQGEAVTVEVINQFNQFIESFMSRSFHDYYADKEYQPGPGAVTPFQEVLKAVINLDCEIEIIGYWIYCFKSFAVHEKLRELEFWFSRKHRAWVYSGSEKRKYASRQTLDEIRAEKGSQKVEKEEKQKNLELAV
jgi:curved DNA-binding protein CbpA